MYKKYQCVLRAMGSLQASAQPVYDAAVELARPDPATPIYATRTTSHSHKSGAIDSRHATESAPMRSPGQENVNEPSPGALDPLERARGDFLELCRGNRYTTTLHCLNSAIVKLSKIQKAVKVYRGMSRAALPKTFWHPSETNCRGAVEVSMRSNRLLTARRGARRGVSRELSLRACW